jgi:hypothetical protein
MRQFWEFRSHDARFLLASCQALVPKIVPLLTVPILHHNYTTHCCYSIRAVCKKSLYLICPPNIIIELATEISRQKSTFGTIRVSCFFPFALSSILHLLVRYSLLIHQVCPKKIKLKKNLMRLFHFLPPIYYIELTITIYK